MEPAKILKEFFSCTAWEMTSPRPYSVFHLSLCAFGISCAVLLSLRLGRKEKRPVSVLFFCGLILLFLELYKQGFLYFIECEGHYNWWYFPFQLCSVPMYLCLFLPFSGRHSAALATFIQDFGLLGGIMALLEPSGLMHPYWTMTLHGFLWHFILIFAGLSAGLSRLSDRSWRVFLRTLPVFFLCCLLALFINTAAGPEADADMFYISPYHPSSQVIFHQISLALGTLPGILIYIASMTAGAALVHEGMRIFLRRRGNQ